MRADFIGRQAEMARLFEAVDQVRAGHGGVITISGAAGTGKSRLVEEFKGHVDGKIQWLEGFAYAHRQQTPYAPFTLIETRVLVPEDGGCQTPTLAGQ